VSSKIRALWLDLHAAGYVDDPSEKALNAYVMRSSGIADLHWITGGQATKVIEELKKWRRRDIGRIAKLMNKVRSKGVAMPLYRGEDARFVAHVCEAVTGSRDDGRANLEAVIRHLEALLNG
jgi:phage gp16-like protein